MAQPIFDWMNGGLTGDHDPGTNEPWDNGIIQYGVEWRNSNNDNIWFCTGSPHTDSEDPDINTGLSWKFLGQLQSSAPAQKTIHSVSSPSFNSPRTPSSTLDVDVNAILGISVTVLETSTITAQVDTGSGYTTVGQWSIGLLSLSGLVNTLSFKVPAGAAYKLIASGTGTTSIVSLLEIY
jgi:hypothetical protein